jgi:putative zinc finger protein
VPDHPDHERLAAFQAGDVDRRERIDVEAHLAGCSSCAELVASVGRARGSLALLEEPDLPPGLHDRLAATVEAEVAAGADAEQPATGRPGILQRPGSNRRAGSRGRKRAGSGGTERAGAEGREGDGTRGPDGAAEPRVLRPAPWYRRPAAWGAAAALLLAALVIPFLNQSGSDLDTTAVGDAGGGAAQEAATSAPAAAGGLPVFRVAGEVTVDTVRTRLATDARAKGALDRAASPQVAGQAEGPYRSSAGAASADARELQSCLTAATAAANTATRPLSPAFFVEGTYEGREATILVTTSTTQPGRVDLWVFPRNNCTAPPLATKQVR